MEECQCFLSIARSDLLSGKTSVFSEMSYFVITVIFACTIFTCTCCKNEQGKEKHNALSSGLPVYIS